jgi:Na+-driven multidrug efflux pump
VANELGAGNGKGARFATIVSSVTSLVIGLFFWVLIMSLHDKIAVIFTSSSVVLDAVDHLSVLLAFTILLNSIQPVLSGQSSVSVVFFLHLFTLLLCGPDTPVGPITSYSPHRPIVILIVSLML